MLERRCVVVGRDPRAATAARQCALNVADAVAAVKDGVRQCGGPRGGPVDQRHSLAQLKGSLEGWAEQVRERGDVAALTMPMSRNRWQWPRRPGAQPLNPGDPQGRWAIEHVGPP